MFCLSKADPFLQGGAPHLAKLVYGLWLMLTMVCGRCIYIYTIYGYLWGLNNQHGGFKPSDNFSIKTET